MYGYFNNIICINWGEIAQIKTTLGVATLVKEPGGDILKLQLDPLI